MIGWLQGIQKKTERLTLEAVAHAREAVWNRTQARIQSMGVAEARGYTRARARIVVRNSVTAVIQRDGRRLSTNAQSRILTATLDAVVDWVVERRQVAPAVTRRAA